MLLARNFAVPSFIRLVVFDLDGTLVTHNYDYWCREAVRIYPLLGAKSVTLAGVRRDFGSDKFFASLPVRDREGLISKFWELYDHRNSPDPRCLPGVRRTLKQLKGFGLAIAIATARMEPRSSLVAKLTRWGISTYVDFALTCADAEEEPCPSKLPMLLQLLQLAGVSGREALMIGDTPSDIESARLAGYAMQLAVCTGGLYPETLASAQPTSVVNSVSSLHCSSWAGRNPK